MSWDLAGMLVDWSPVGLDELALQTALSLHQKGVISTKTLLSEFDLDYGQEVALLREEQAKYGEQNASAILSVPCRI